jgi:fructuronate reductase
VTGAAPELTREHARARPAAPVRSVHLGLGAFFRAHQAWYTERAPDAGDWGIAAFGGRGGDVAAALELQGGVYTLLTRGPGRDTTEVVASISAAHDAADHAGLLARLSSPDVGVVTLTVTEAGYCRDAGGSLDRTDPVVGADIAVLRADPCSPVRSLPARLVAGLEARRRNGGGPIALVPCDNLPANGRALQRVVADLVDAVDPGLAPWLDDSVSFVTTVVDRITPRTGDADVAAVERATGWHDRAPVVTEPFSEWVIEGTFPGGRPAWDQAGAVVVDDAEPYARRKLGLLNGGHSLLAYLGSVRGHTTVAEAVDDATCLTWLRRWWAEAAGELRLPTIEVAAYEEQLLTRFGNPRVAHRLEQIAADGSQKLPVRVLPTLRYARAAGTLPPGAACVLAAWTCHLRGGGAPVTDVRAAELVTLAAGPSAAAVARVLAALDPALADDEELGATVASFVDAIERTGEP